MAVLEADGIDGSTLLGFLAAVGSLRLLAEKHPTARLYFDRKSDAARLVVGDALGQTDLISAIIERARCSDREAELALFETAERPKEVTSQRVLELARLAWGSQTAVRLGQFISGLVCDGITKSKNTDEATECTLCVANGASQQKMFRTLLDLQNLDRDSSRKLVTVEPPLLRDENIRSSLLAPWTFSDEVPKAAVWMKDRKPTLRWDEGSDRLYALRLYQPNDDPEPFRTQLGAYVLAAAALPCFPVVPTRRGGQTSFTQRPPDRRGRPSSTEIDFYWYLWDVPASLATVTAFQASGEPLTDPASARRRGVYRLLRARRTSMEKGKLVFAPAEAVW